ncbi:caspase domain-containing protein [Vararia minispora EC-137]|uniref:Caspase domain-containing protein n=1 Tax=Vararia minispora EC-137 TaxID=1314806 RepID=A0ACB8QEV1_9AGAM|nr:caspase domain-containing protein [Vararia minispora EC-137]
MSSTVYSTAMSALDVLVALLRRKDNQTTQQVSPLHALIIGIDKYKSGLIDNLRGAVADADAIASYVRNQLKVPQAQIINLRNQDATRHAIIQALKGLRDIASIRHNDPILIYFAGHGSTAPCPSGWHSSDGRIQLIVPYDALTRDASTNHLIEHPETGKGDNITVIFDCCFSGSGTRDSPPVSVDDPTLLERGFESTTAVSALLDKNIWGAVPCDRALSIAAGFAHTGSKSHVLLAACGDGETAKEHRGRGLFTTVLLDALNSLSTDKTTYLDLMKRVMDLPDQTPQCEGEHADRILFNARAPSKARTTHRVIRRDGAYIIDAGEIQALTPNMKFAVYSSPIFTTEDQSLGTLRATVVHPFTTDAVLTEPFGALATIPDSTSLFALQTTVGRGYSMKLYIPVDPRLHSVFEAAARELETHYPTQLPILFVDDAEKAHLRIALDESDDAVRYEIGDPLITRFGPTRLLGTTPLDAAHVQPVLHAAAHFFQYLHHSPKKNLLRKKVTVEVPRLEASGEVDDNLYDTMQPASEPSLVVDGRVNVEADGKTKYGVTVKNDFNAPLFVSVFFFDCGTLSIQPYYISPVASRHVPSLPGKGMLPIGYGDGGGRPYNYTLSPGEDIELGFLKIFISTQFVDLREIRQSSPLNGERVANENVPSPAPVWDTITIAIVQRRKTAPA